MKAKTATDKYSRTNFLIPHAGVLARAPVCYQTVELEQDLEVRFVLCRFLKCECSDVTNYLPCTEKYTVPYCVCSSAKHTTGRMNDFITETSFGQDHQSRDRRTIYFSSGDTLEQSDGEEEEDEEPIHKEPFSQSLDTASMSWGEYSRFLGTKFGKKSLRMCDFLGEKLARLLGLHAAKYQYAVDEFRRSQKKKKDMEEESSDMADDAESFNLSPRTSRNYGATSSDNVLSALPSPSSVPVGVKHTAADNDNRGYQEDDQ